MIGQDPEMLQMFLEEASEHLSNLEPDLLKLEENPEIQDQELINRIFRAVHSLKGSAGFFGFENVTKLSHIMENILSLVRDGKRKPSSSMITSLLKGTDKLNQMVDDIENSESVDIDAELEELNRILNNEEAPKAINETEKVALKTKDETTLEEKIAREFEISIDDLKLAASKGHFLYAVKAYTHKDMKDKNKLPLDYIREIGKMGYLLGSYSDISDISGLSDDIKNQDLAFIFLFSSVLEPDLIAIGLQVDEDQIQQLDFPKTIEEKKHKTTDKQKNQAKPPKEESTQKPIKETKEPQSSSDSTPKEKPTATLSNTSDKKPVVAKKESSHKNETLRVSVSLLNDLMTLAGELVLARNQLLRMTNEVVKTVPGLQNVTQDINSTTTMLQQKIMDTRMQPISLVFNKFPRMIRDMGKMLNKQINLETSGNNVDLDKSIIENLSDPLTHLVRNAVDHALEPTAERIKAGKPEAGNIWLKAYHEGGKVNIDVIDDGKGIDPEKILNKVLEKGLLTEADAKRLTEKEIINLIFLPGFSTAEKISNISGRGVGMDVVKTNIEKLGGSVSIDSKLGEGTIINLKLPLTLAIIPSLIVKVHNMQFALPQVALKELVRIKKGDTKRKIELVNNAPVLRLRNKLLPIVYLEDVLKLGKSTEDREITRILVLKSNENEFGLVVDEISDSEEIVVKSIPRFFKGSLCYSGTTIMGDGSVALILDVNGITLQSKLIFSNTQETSSKNDTEEEDKYVNKDVQNLLLFENAKDEIFALNLDLIKRIEKINIKDFDIIGNKTYIEHEGKSLRVIRLEHYLPVVAPSEEDEFLYVIIPTQIENPIGIIAHKIIDSITTNVSIDTDNISSKGLIGSTLMNNKIVLFPDIYELTEMADPERSIRSIANNNNKYKILLVEDTPFFRTIVKQYLVSAGYRVDVAIDGMDGLSKIKQNQDYDLFIVDIVMPRLDGYEFVKNIRKDENYKDTPAIALTTLNNQQSKQKAFEVGFNAYEVKVYKEKLLESVKSFLEDKEVSYQ